MLTDLLPLIPYDHVYVDVFGGGGSVLLSRDHSNIEVFNDLDDLLTNLYSVLRDPESFELFRRMVEFTPYSKVDFGRAIDIVTGHRTHESCDCNPLDLAWAFYTQMNQAVVGSVRRTKGQWSRTVMTSGPRASTVGAWLGMVANLDVIHQRVQHLQIDQRDAIECLEYWDSPNTVFYVDPPYVHDTRVVTEIYAHEMDLTLHGSLVDQMLECQGYVTLSGYDHPVYEPLVLNEWTRHEFKGVTSMTASHRGGDDGWDREIRTRGERTEVVWTNPKVDSYLANQAPTLF